MNATRILVALYIVAASSSMALAQTANVIREPADTTKPMTPATAPSSADLLGVPPGAGQYPPPQGLTPEEPGGGGIHGLNGPIGGNGLLTYEIYAITGVTMPVGGGDLSASLKTGWETGGGTRTLWFNKDSTAAWILDLGVTYAANNGREQKVLNVFTPQVDPTTGDRIADGLANYHMHGLYRTNLNFGLGRDWWLWGPATLQTEQSSNIRFGFDGGGRYGTAHVNLVPVDDPTNYLKRDGVTHGVYIGGHIGWEKPMGAWILTTDLRAEWSYDWTNLIPPLGGDVHNVNILWTVGVRF